MTTLEKIARLRKLVERLQAVDRNFTAFGSRSHRYQFGPVLSEAELITFEAEHGVQLPEDFRCFLGNVANGGAGPYFGLLPLRNYGPSLSVEFPFTRPSYQYTKEEQQLLGCDEYPGLIELCHQGCGIVSYLVVNGPAYGFVWDGLEDFHPTKLSFADWYRKWAKFELLCRGRFSFWC